MEEIKHKMGNFDIIVYPEGFSFWYNGLCIIDASKFESTRQVICREGGESGLKVELVQLKKG